MCGLQAHVCSVPPAGMFPLSLLLSALSSSLCELRASRGQDTRGLTCLRILGSQQGAWGPEDAQEIVTVTGRIQLPARQPPAERGAGWRCHATRRGVRKPS